MKNEIVILGRVGLLLGFGFFGGSGNLFATKTSVAAQAPAAPALAPAALPPSEVSIPEKGPNAYETPSPLFPPGSENDDMKHLFKSRRRDGTPVVFKGPRPDATGGLLLDREARLLTELKGVPGFPQLLDDFTDESGTRYLVLPFYDGGDLHSRLKADFSAGLLNEENARQMFRQLVVLVQVLHARHLYHLDIKPENILMHIGPEESKTGRPRLILADLGFAEMVFPQRLLQGARGTDMFQPPEMYNPPHVFNPRDADIYSLGITLFSMLTAGLVCNVPSLTDKHYEIWQGQREPKMKNYLRARGNTDLAKSAVCDLLDGMLSTDLAKKPRLTIEQILAHPWLNPVKASAPGAAAAGAGADIPDASGAGAERKAP